MGQSHDRVAIARTVLPSRRVTLPREMRARAQFAKGMYVVWARAGDSRASLMMRPDAGDPQMQHLVRKVNSAWQVVIPPALTHQVKLEIGDWVYLTLGADQRSIRLTPARHVQMGPPLKDVS